MSRIAWFSVCVLAKAFLLPISMFFTVCASLPKNLGICKAKNWHKTML